MPSPPKTRDKMIQFSEPMTLTTILETVKISVPFKNLLLLPAVFSVSPMLTRLIPIYIYTYSYIIIIYLKPLFDKLFRFYFTKSYFLSKTAGLLTQAGSYCKYSLFYLIAQTRGAFRRSSWRRHSTASPFYNRCRHCVPHPDRNSCFCCPGKQRLRHIQTRYH